MSELGQKRSPQPGVQAKKTTADAWGSGERVASIPRPRMVSGERLTSVAPAKPQRISPPLPKREVPSPSLSKAEDPPSEAALFDAVDAYGSEEHPTVAVVGPLMKLLAKSCVECGEQAVEGAPEAPEGAVGDRITPDFAAPSALLRLTCDAPDERADAQEREFWDNPPRYSTTSVHPEAPVSLPPAPRSPRPPRRVAQLLIASLLAGGLTLLVYETSVVHGLRWSNLSGAVDRVASHWK